MTEAQVSKLRIAMLAGQYSEASKMIMSALVRHRHQRKAADALGVGRNTLQRYCRVLEDRGLLEPGAAPVGRPKSRENKGRKKKLC